MADSVAIDLCSSSDDDSIDSNSRFSATERRQHEACRELIQRQLRQERQQEQQRQNQRHQHRQLAPAQQQHRQPTNSNNSRPSTSRQLTDSSHSRRDDGYDSDVCIIETTRTATVPLTMHRSNARENNFNRILSPRGSQSSAPSVGSHQPRQFQQHQQQQQQADDDDDDDCIIIDVNPASRSAPAENNNSRGRNGEPKIPREPRGRSLPPTSNNTLDGRQRRQQWSRQQAQNRAVSLERSNSQRSSRQQQQRPRVPNDIEGERRRYAQNNADSREEEEQSSLQRPSSTRQPRIIVPAVHRGSLPTIRNDGEHRSVRPEQASTAERNQSQRSQIERISTSLQQARIALNPRQKATSDDNDIIVIDSSDDEDTTPQTQICPPSGNETTGGSAQTEGARLVERKRNDQNGDSVARIQSHRDSRGGSQETLPNIEAAAKPNSTRNIRFTPARDRLHVANTNSSIGKKTKTSAMRPLQSRA